MKKVRLIASKLNVEIEAINMIVTYVIEGDDSESAVIPLSYASIVDIDDGTYPDDGITFTLGLKRAGERAYLEEQTAANRHIRFPSDRNIRFPYCVHKTIDDVMNSYFIDNDLAEILMEFLDTIANLNYEYLRSHRVDATAVKEISETIHGVRKAKRIVSKKFGTEKNDEH
ncbi:MAG: hypothetical protein [Bacteriophage sp.]|nr:MAG: hypothetical protein [Bacteriophage sp.]